MNLRNSAKTLYENGFAHVFIGTFMNKAIAMISSVIVARLIDKTEYAYLTYSETLYGYLSLFLGLGMSSALLKVCSGKENTALDKAYLIFAAKYGIAFEIIVTTIFCSSILFIVLPFEQARYYIFITLLYPLFYYCYDLLVCFLRAKQLNKEYAWLSLLYSALSCVLTIGLVYFINAQGVVFARYITLVILIICLIIPISKKLKTIQKTSVARDNLKMFISMSLSLMLANALSGMMPINENLLVSNIIADEVSTSNFRVASLFPQLIILITQSVMIYYFPIVSEMDNKGQNPGKYVLKVAGFNFALVIGGIIVGILLTPWLIVTFYGQKYADAIPIARMLWLVHGINAAFRIVPMNMLIAVRKYKFNLYMSIFSVLIQFTLDWLLITHFGMMGVMYGTGAVYIISSFLYWWYLRNSLANLYV